MQIEATEIPEVKILTPKRFGDARGFFSEVYKRRALAEAGIDLEFVQDNQSLSQEVGTLRGLHFQAPPFAQVKLVRVLRGRIFDVAVDIRQNSPTYRRWVGVELTAENFRQLLIPIGFLHGFITLEPDAEVLYKVSAPYSARARFWRRLERSRHRHSLAKGSRQCRALRQGRQTTVAARNKEPVLGRAMRLIVTGTAEGQLVGSLIERAPLVKAEIIAVGLPELDMSDPSTMAPALAGSRPTSSSTPPPLPLSTRPR